MCCYRAVSTASSYEIFLLFGCPALGTEITTEGLGLMNPLIWFAPKFNFFFQFMVDTKLFVECHLHVFFQKWAIPVLFVYFRSFQTQILQKNWTHQRDSISDRKASTLTTSRPQGPMPSPCCIENVFPTFNSSVASVKYDDICTKKGFDLMQKSICT